MIHQPASSLVDGQTVDCILEANELRKMRETIIYLFAKRTGKPSWQIDRDMDRDFYMSGEEAKAYGLVDIVGESV